MHAENRESPDQDASRQLIHDLRSCDTALCVDEGFDADEARNRSGIAGEYFEHLPHGALGLVLIYECALDGRVRSIPSRIDASANRAVNRLVWDRSDRKFVKVSINSEEHVLVTHNSSHFMPAESELRSRFSIELLDAYACRTRL